ncbi:ATP-binding protein [Amycolatopsis sp. WAC 04182]|uniref:ATP-binding protein n=1 Tax=Amycolatopsis sp. WAC 04182 TaxID=2203198 RepID=UPI000F7ADDA0|nr:ATP-binding protein [Amycolatopsis sp. WAC 04182]
MSTQPGTTERSEPDPSTVAYDLDTTSTRAVRHGVRQALGGYRGLAVDDAVLVADELVSNAHQHGDAPRACRLELTHRGSLRIEVDDASPRQPRRRTPDGTGGRGLLLIDRLASAWGVRNHADHKTVWVELALNREGNHAPHLAAARTWHNED